MVVLLRVSYVCVRSILKLLNPKPNSVQYSRFRGGRAKVWGQRAGGLIQLSGMHWVFVRSGLAGPHCPSTMEAGP